jgi:TRAP-type transport system periplasmic protein
MRKNREKTMLKKLLGYARFTAAAAVISLAAAPGAPAVAQSTMKLASATINDVQHEWQKVFAAELAERVGDAVTTEIYPASQLGAIPRMAEGVLLGTIEAFTTPTSFMTNVDPRFQAFDVPGLFTSPEDVRRAIHDPEYRDHLEEMFLDKGLRVIGAIYNSPTVVFTMQPVTELEQMRGLKIRTFASPMQMGPMELLGASPLPLALSEVVPQLESGGLDGLLVGMPILTAFKYYDIGKHITDLRFAEIVSVTVVNETGSRRKTPRCRTPSSRRAVWRRKRCSTGAWRMSSGPTPSGRKTAASSISCPRRSRPTWKLASPNSPRRLSRRTLPSKPNISGCRSWCRGARSERLALPHRQSSVSPAAAQVSLRGIAGPSVICQRVTYARPSMPHQARSTGRNSPCWLRVAWPPVAGLRQMSSDASRPGVMLASSAENQCAISAWQLTGSVPAFTTVSGTASISAVAAAVVAVTMTASRTGRSF